MLRTLDKKKSLKIKFKYNKRELKKLEMFMSMKQIKLIPTENQLERNVEDHLMLLNDHLLEKMRLRQRQMLLLMLIFTEPSRGERF
jgi:hypothetical protein